MAFFLSRTTQTIICVCFLFVGSQLTAQQEPEKLKGDPDNGRKLFEKEWSEVKFFDEEHSDSVDGLGPMFNAESCVACHNLGGLGGAGDNTTNVQILSALPRQKSNGEFRLDEPMLELMFANASKIHPDLAKKNSIVLHRSSTLPSQFAIWQRNALEFRGLKNANPDEIPSKIEARREKLLNKELNYRVKKEDLRNRFTLQITRRNTPPLFGVNQIDLIPDSLIRAVAKRQADRDDHIKGKVAELPDDKIGKFGWRGQHSSVRHFTVEACAVEIGLSNSEHKQMVAPFGHQTSSIAENDAQILRFLNREFADPNLENTEHDMTDQEVEDMVSFVKSLPALFPLSPRKEADFKAAQKGHELFDSIGCADCHVENMGPARGVFSDFLLHDMGPKLADAAGVLKVVGSNIEIEDDRAWQTPPLWGVAISAPYMHDGRASDLTEAIMVHGGEALKSRDAFKDLKRSDQKALLKFLSTLGDGANQPSRGNARGPVVARGGWSFSTPPPRRRRGRLANSR